MIEIRQCPIAEILSAEKLLAEYAKELAIDGLPYPKAKTDLYAKMEELKILYPIAAYLDGVLVGFVNVLMSDNPHYNVRIASTESFFVSSEHRKSGAGLRLLRAAENCAKELGSSVLFISAPIKGSLVHVLPEVGYTDTAHTFFKVLSDV